MWKIGPCKDIFKKSCESTDQQVFAHIPPFPQRIVLRINRSTGFWSHIGGKISPCKDIFNESLRINRSTGFCTYTPILAKNCVATQQINRFLEPYRWKNSAPARIFSTNLCESTDQQVFAHIPPFSQRIVL